MNKAYDLEFTNFVPTIHEEILVHGILKSLMELAPYGSICAAFLRRDEPERYSAELTITAPHDKFEAAAIGPTCTQVAESLEYQIEQQFEHWRANRFKLHPTAA